MVQRPVVSATIAIPVIPAQHHPGSRDKAFPELRKSGRPSRCGFVEIDHEGRGSLTGNAAIFLEIGSSRIEEIRVRLELLANGVALTLQGLAKYLVDIGKAADFLVDFGYESICMIEVTGFAGPEIMVAIGIGDRRGAPLIVDQFNQLFAFRRRQEIPQYAQFDLPSRKPLHLPQANEIGSRCIAVICHLTVHNRPSLGNVTLNDLPLIATALCGKG